MISDYDELDSVLRVELDELYINKLWDYVDRKLEFKSKIELEGILHMGLSIELDSGLGDELNSELKKIITI